jgi:hypothetical protein
LSAPGETPERIRRIAGFASDAAIVWGVACLLLVLVVGGAHLALRARYGSIRVFDHYKGLSEVQKAVYGSSWTPADLNDMLTWTWSPGWIYEPWVGFREKPRASRFVNVSADGVRATKGGAADLSAVGPESVFVFGGSTMFGYGVADAETVSSHLQSILGAGARVHNLGRAYYYSRQENVLFESLVHAGLRPKIAVFVDGLNERCDLDAYQKELGALFARAQGEYEWRASDAAYPLLFIAGKLGKLAGRGEPAAPAFDLHRLDCERHGRHAPLAQVLGENLARREQLCAEAGIRCVTVLQPIPGVHGEHPDRSQHSDAARATLQRKFAHMLPAFRAHPMVDATGALDGLGPAYVDGLHYSSAASRALAARIAESLGKSSQ